MIKTFELYDNDGIDDDNPWSGILAAVMAAVRSTYLTTQATPMQLVFSRDAIINTKFLADWNFICQHKQNIIHQNKIKKEPDTKWFFKTSNAPLTVRMKNGNHIRTM
jgi:hypothetical protein